MMCYRDMTFCKYYFTCSQGAICSRALTSEVKRRAIAVDMPISQFAGVPECYNKPKRKEDQRRP